MDRAPKAVLRFVERMFFAAWSQLGSNMMNQLRRWLPLRFVLLAAAFGMAARAASGQDPVETLREDLKRTAIGAIPDVAPEILEFRRTKIKKGLDQLKTIGQMRRALMLDEWKVEWKIDLGGVPLPTTPEVKLDTEMRRILGERFTKEAEKMARHPESTARLALADMICEMTPTVRSIDPNNSGGFTRGLTPLISQLCRDSDLAVRQESLRALGNLNGPAKEVADVFRATLQQDKEIGPRRLAADGLQQMMRVVSHLNSRQSVSTGVVASRQDVLDTLQAIAPVASVGLADTDSEVRMLSLQAVQAAALALADILEAPPAATAATNVTIPIPGRKNYPPAGRELTQKELENIFNAYRQAEADIASAKPMIDALRKEVLTYTQGLRDPEARVRLAAAQAFEALANARLRLIRRANILPSIKSKDGVARSPADLIKEADFLQPVLDREMPQVINLLTDPDVRIRRTVATALEGLEEKAAPAMAGLITALRDPDRFVRWSAAKVLGYLPLDKAGPAIGPLAKLLADPDLPVRIAAANSLEALGAVAQEATLPLAQSLKTGDVEARLSSMYALSKIGAANLVPALPALIGCLTDRDPRIIRAACELIDEIGPAATSALPVLRRLIGHEDSGVRQAASDAITSVLRSPE
jgi:HEAT repeat protein